MPLKTKSITTSEIEVAIAKYFNIRKHIIVPNVSWGFDLHECDLFIIRQSGFAIEVEIKISKSDLLADFNKKHNHIDRQNRISEFYYALPFKLYNDCKDLIPENAGILVCDRHYNSYRKTYEILACLQKKAKRIKNARKLTTEEQFKITRLGVMRIFSLKEKIIKLKDKIKNNEK